MGIPIPISNSRVITSVILDDEFYCPEQPQSPLEEMILTPEVTPIISEPIPELKIEPVKIAYSEQLNYRVQCWINEHLYTYIEEKESLRPMASIAISLSALADIILRISSIAETVFYSLEELFLFPFTKDLSTAWVWTTQIPGKILDLVIFPLKLIENSICMLVIPRHFIFEELEYAKVNRKHLENETLNTQAHERDLMEVPAKAKGRLIEFQERKALLNDF